MQNLIVIVGPTASGKSTLAIDIAKKYNGEIISADSRQIYRGMDIGTGKITKKEMSGISHHLLDITSPKRIFTVADYQKHAQHALQDIWQCGKLPILCGGTGLYIKAVVHGIMIPEVKPNLTLRKKLEKKNTQALFQILLKKDPRRAKKIDRHNPRRLIRALEIVDSLGKVPRLKQKPLDANVLFIGIKKNKEELKKLIHIRLLKRLKQRMIQEVLRLHNNGVAWKRLHDFGLEYRFIAQFLQKKITREEMISSLERAIYDYAKRQMTWFQKENGIVWISASTKAFLLTKRFLDQRS